MRTNKDIPYYIESMNIRKNRMFRFYKRFFLDCSSYNDAEWKDTR